MFWNRVAKGFSIQPSSKSGCNVVFNLAWRIAKFSDTLFTSVNNDENVFEIVTRAVVTPTTTVKSLEF